MALGKMFTRVSVVMITGAVVGACGGAEEDTAALPPADSTAMTMPVVPPPITDTSTVAIAPGVTPAPGPAPGAVPAGGPGATPAVTTPAPKAAPPAATGGGGNAADGQQLYATGVCMACHGPAGAGTALAPALNDNQWLWFTTRPTQEQVVTLIKTGIATPKSHPAPMPANGGGAYTDAQVRSLAAYVLSISG